MKIARLPCIKVLIPTRMTVLPKFRIMNLKLVGKRFTPNSYTLKNSFTLLVHPPPDLFIFAHSCSGWSVDTNISLLRRRPIFRGGKSSPAFSLCTNQFAPDERTRQPLDYTPVPIDTTTDHHKLKAKKTGTEAVCIQTTPFPFGLFALDLCHEEKR